MVNARFTGPSDTFFGESREGQCGDRTRPKTEDTVRVPGDLVPVQSQTRRRLVTRDTQGSWVEGGICGPVNV